MSKSVYVGMSGGVDSSVTAKLLLDQGYKVTGVYMKNWAQDLPGFHCPWREDLLDAKRVAVQLGIPFKIYDFQDTYKQKVVDYMIEGYKQGITPNPDIMCNQEVKFKVFLEAALADGADYVATGHYARTQDGKLLRAKDDNKDQTYFLYRVSSEALQSTLFPLGDYTKPEVRKLAEQYGLATAKKKESMGICFVGKVGIHEFLSQFVETEPGKVLNQQGEVLGEHEGAIFYTIGQRHGLRLGGGLPYYVIGKDMDKNEVYVTTDLNDENLWNKSLKLTSIHWVAEQPENMSVLVRTRHRATLIPAQLVYDTANPTQATLELADEIRAITPGQSAVLYQDNEVLGGGIIYQ